MPKIIDQPVDLGDLPRLHSEEHARTFLKAGRNKWWQSGLRDQIEFVKIGRSRFYSDAALLAYLQRQTHKPKLPEQPRRTSPAAKPVPAPPRGRRSKARDERRSTA